MENGEEKMSELSYVLVTPEAVSRGMAGVVLSRLMARTELELAAARLVKFSKTSAEELAQLVDRRQNKPEKNRRRMVEYIRGTFAGEAPGFFLLFRGEDAVAKVRAQVGHGEDATAATIRGSLGELVEVAGSCVGFEPVALIPGTRTELEDELPWFAGFLTTDNLIAPAPAAGEERTLLIIKPENWRAPGVRPGAIIDMLGATGLRWVGCKMHGMSVAEALEFYGPVRQALRAKLGPKLGVRALALLEAEFKVKFDAEPAEALVRAAGNGLADDEFERIVEFMAGKRPSAVPESERSQPAGARCMVLVFDGPDAVARVRTILGPTDPSKAPGGTVRHDFGTDIMVNAAHASDSTASFEREGRIVRIHENEVAALIRAR